MCAIFVHRNSCHPSYTLIHSYTLRRATLPLTPFEGTKLSPAHVVLLKRGEVGSSVLSRHECMASHPVWRNQTLSLSLSLSCRRVEDSSGSTTWVHGNIKTMATIPSAMPLAICMMTSPTRVLIGLDRALIINENWTEWHSLPVWRKKKPLSYLKDPFDTRRVRSIAILNIALTIWPMGILNITTTIWFNPSHDLS